MATWIKPTLWEELCKTCKGYKGWLNLDKFVEDKIESIGNESVYGTFLSLVQQSSTANVTATMRYEETYLSEGVSITNDLSGHPTRITFATTGIYNIQFSAQLYNSDGGGNTAAVQIWLKTDGNNAVFSNTKISVIPNSPYVVAAWNWFLPVTAGHYVEIAWQPSVTGIVIETIAASTTPGIPSIILTVNKVG